MISSSILRQFTLLLLLPSAGFAVDVTLEWDPNPEPDIIGYRIYYGRVPGGAPQRIEVGRQSRGVLSGLPAGAIWYAWATALNASGLEGEPADALLFNSSLVPNSQSSTVQMIILRSIAPMSDQPSPIPPPPAEQETDDGNRPDSGLIGSRNYQQVYQFEAPTTDAAFIPPPDVPAENNFLTLGTSPQSQSLFTGGTVVLGVISAATGPVSWQWLHNGNSIPDAVFPTLTIGPATPAEAGDYQLRMIMDKTEILTEPAVLSVWPRPTLTLSHGPDRLDPEENGLEVLVSGESLQPLSLEFSENLTEWSLLEAFQLDDQGTRTILDPTKTARQRFYRLRAGE